MLRLDTQANTYCVAGHGRGQEITVDLLHPSDAEGNGRVCVYGLDRTSPACFQSTIPGASRNELLPLQRNAPMADGLGLLCVRGERRVVQSIEVDAVRICADGQFCTRIDFSDFRKHLMAMGLFPSHLYATGETFDEMRLRYGCCI